MKVIVGLGNPGSEYAKTRHNAGFMVVDRLAEKHAPGQTPRARFNAVTFEFRLASRTSAGSGQVPVLLLKPTTYMNRSGQSVAECVRFFKVDPVRDVLVVVDDLYTPCGQVRLRPSGGAGGHNGLADIQRALGTDAYPRVRVGIDPKPPHMDQADYVLGRFTDEQWALARPAIDRAAEACEMFVAKGLDAAMNAFNAPPTPDRPPKPPRPPPAPPGATRGATSGSPSGAPAAVPNPPQNPSAI